MILTLGKASTGSTHAKKLKISPPGIQAGPYINKNNDDRIGTRYISKQGSGNDILTFLVLWSMVCSSGNLYE